MAPQLGHLERFCESSAYDCALPHEGHSFLSTRARYSFSSRVRRSPSQRARSAASMRRTRSSPRLPLPPLPPSSSSAWASREPPPARSRGRKRQCRLSSSLANSARGFRCCRRFVASALMASMLTARRVDGRGASSASVASSSRRCVSVSGSARLWSALSLSRMVRGACSSAFLGVGFLDFLGFLGGVLASQSSAAASPVAAGCSASVCAASSASNSSAAYCSAAASCSTAATARCCSSRTSPATAASVCCTRARSSRSTSAAIAASA